MAKTKTETETTIEETDGSEVEDFPLMDAEDVEEPSEDEYAKYLEELTQRLGVQEYAGKFDVTRIRHLVYGESGAGKTRHAATWPDPIFLDIDKGMASITHKVHRIPINSWTDAQDAYIYLSQVKHMFRTVIVDSLNELQYVAMRNVVESFPSIRRPYGDLAGQSDYGKMLDDFDKFLRAFKVLPMNVVFICNEARREFETDPVTPALVGKNSVPNLTRMMDTIGHLSKVESGEGHKERVMVFDAVNYTTKDRSGKLPAKVKSPDFDALLHYWTI